MKQSNRDINQVRLGDRVMDRVQIALHGQHVHKLRIKHLSTVMRGEILQTMLYRQVNMFFIHTDSLIIIE